MKLLKNKKLLIGYKLFFSLLGFSAIVTEIAVLSQWRIFTPVNFFSYFTILTNILVFITLLLSAIAVAAGKGQVLDRLRGATTVYILVVGLGFAILLSGLDNIIFTAVPWDNVVLHYLIPVAVLIDFLIDRPQTKLSFVRALSWLVFPLAYLIYSLVRGAVTGWYPYPFLDPIDGGYSKVALMSLAIFALTLLIAWVVTRLSGRRH